MWNHVKKLYHQTNKARKFCQGDRMVQESYSGFLALWIERDQMLLHSVSSNFIPQALKLQEELCISQFLMNLHLKFEPVQASIMNRENSPDLNTYVQEVLREEIRLMSQQSLITKPKALLTTPALTPIKEIALLAARGQKTQCHECKGYGHLARNCRKKLFCNYCKRTRHIISECTRRPPRRNEQPPKQGQNVFEARHSRVRPPNHAKTITLTPAQI